MNQINSKEELEKLISNGPVVLKFTADSCGPCKLFAPTLEQLSDTHDHITFVDCDVYVLQDIAVEHNISSIPTLEFYKDGKLIDKTVGIKSIKDLEKQVEKLND